MNRKNLTAAVLAGLAGVAGIVGSAQAVNINPDGLGEVLIYPYYTTNGGNATVLSVVNTTDHAKAVKVRFKEGANSREVLDFNLYMSAWDVWTAAIVDNAGTPSLIVNDNTCTVPYLYENDGGMQEFLVYGMNDTATADTYGDIARATEGYFEMIEMGTIQAESDTEEFVTHVDGLMPLIGDDEINGCHFLTEAWTIEDDLKGLQGYWWDDAQEDLNRPSGGLFGGAAVINVANGTMYSYEAKALNGFTNESHFGFHTYPGSVQPSLNDGDTRNGTVFGDEGELLVSADFDRSVDAVSFVFMHDTLMNEYTTEAAIGGATEWVLTFPTKSFYVYSDESGSDDALAPFTSTWDGDEACEVVGLDTIWDRNEQTIITVDPTGNEIPPIVSPAPPVITDKPDPIVPFELCYEVSVIAFGAAGSSSILGSNYVHQIDNEALGFEHGWARLELDDYTTDENEDGKGESNTRAELGGLEGLPVTGFAVQSFTNGFLGEGSNVMANYGSIFDHKATRKTGSLIQ